MRRLAVVENEPIPVGVPEGVSADEFARLRRFDERHASRSGDTVFDWSRASSLVARDYVGVVQVPGISIEILPKTDDDGDAHRAQKNLLYMLETAGVLKPRDRSLALLEREPVPLLDAFVLVFADSLIDALRDGLARSYVTVEENLRVLRGRLLVHEQIRRNIVQRQNLYVRYDEFSPDTALNRVLKAACRHLARRVATFQANRRLREILHRFDDVADTAPTPKDMAVQLDRQNVRFRPHLDFARMVFGGYSPSPAAGKESSFSLLFYMPRVFEAFVAGYLQRNAPILGLHDNTRIVVQAGGCYLARDEDGKGCFGLKPDVLARGPGDRVRFVLDTKWKLLPEAAKVSTGDAYQLYAYAQGFDTPLSILLYPWRSGLQERTLRFEGTDDYLRVAFVNVGRDLRSHEAELRKELAAVLRPVELQL